MLRCSRSVCGTNEYVDILTDVKQYKRRLSCLVNKLISVGNTTRINKNMIFFVSKQLHLSAKYVLPKRFELQWGPVSIHQRNSTRRCYIDRSILRWRSTRCCFSDRRAARGYCYLPSHQDAVRPRSPLSLSSQCTKVSVTSMPYTWLSLFTYFMTVFQIGSILKCLHAWTKQRHRILKAIPSFLVQRISTHF